MVNKYALARVLENKNKDNNNEPTFHKYMHSSVTDTPTMRMENINKYKEYSLVSTPLDLGKSRDKEIDTIPLISKQLSQKSNTIVASARVADRTSVRVNRIQNASKQQPNQANDDILVELNQNHTDESSVDNSSPRGRLAAQQRHSPKSDESHPFYQILQNLQK